MPKKKLLVFLSYASEDRNEVVKLFNRLKKDGFDPWMDKDRLLPGQDWKFEIERALRKSDAVILCFSKNSISKESFVQREFKRAVEYKEEKPEGEIYVLPVRLDKSNMPQFVSNLQWVDFPLDYIGLVVALKEREKSLGIKSKLLQNTKITSMSKHLGLSSEILSKATEKILEKKEKMPTMRPDYDLGKPTELKRISSNKKSMALAQFYENGMISCKIRGKNVTEAFATYGGIYSRYRSMSKEPWMLLGLPICDENEAAKSPFLNKLDEQNQGRYGEFENGEIIWYWLGEYRDQAFIILDPIRKHYDNIGGSGSILGFPVSDTYKIKSGSRSDFEGGSIVSLGGKPAHVVLQLLRINYSDSPFYNQWYQYSGPDDVECASIRFDTRIGHQKPYVALNFPFENRAIYFPRIRYVDEQYPQRYCAITIKSLSPTDWIRFYLRLKTTEVRSQYLEFDSQFESRRFFHDSDDDVDYFHIPMPAKSNNGDFHTLIVDLQKMTKLSFGREYRNLEAFYFRGHIGIADLMVSDSREAIEAVAINPIFVE